jgi:hypothetical protein
MFSGETIGLDPITWALATGRKGRPGEVGGLTPSPCVVLGNQRLIWQPLGFVARA